MVKLGTEDKDKIVEKVVEEVLKRLQGKKAGGDTLEEKKKALVIFTGAPGLLEESIKELKSLSGRYRFVVGFSVAARKMSQFSEVEKGLEAVLLDEGSLYEELSKVEVIILPTLTQNTAAKIAWGVRDCLASEAVACGLMMGKRVVAACDSIETLNLKSPYAFLLEEIRDRLVKLGIILCRAKEIASHVEYGISCGMVDGGEAKSFVFDGGLLTSETVKNIASQGYSKLIVNSRCLVTPLAADLLREKKIELVRGMN